MTAPLNSDTLRKQLRLQRQSLSQTQQHQHALSAQKHLLNFLSSILATQAKKTLNIAFFLAQDGELATGSAIQYLWNFTPHHVFLPVLQPQKQMAFAEYTHNSVMKKNTFNILEPDSPANIMSSGQSLDIVFTPLVGFDKFGNRMGMGGGYYDRTFQFKQQSSKIPPLLIGWAHSCQKIEKLSVNPWDIPLNGVITETGFTDFST
jgi:5-formyltetrahydrofolate cyclo-ligase